MKSFECCKEDLSFDEAVSEYHRCIVSSLGSDAILTQPSNVSDYIDGVWHLENCNGSLATVDTNDGVLTIA